MCLFVLEVAYVVVECDCRVGVFVDEVIGGMEGGRGGGWGGGGFFFFQAEDGIRDHCVTGVQTCALPI